MQRIALLSFFALCFLLPMRVQAACLNIISHYSPQLYLKISDNGCYELEVSFTTEVDKNGYPKDEARVRRYPFAKECVRWTGENGLTIGLRCRAGGHTPLAGATYRRRATGHMMMNCEGEGEDYQVVKFQFVCTAGCGRPGVPRRLDAHYPC